MSRATPDLTQGFTGVSLPKTGPRQMGTDADGKTSVITFLNQVTESAASLHDNQTDTRPDYLPVNGLWCYTDPDGAKTIYQYDGNTDVVLSIIQNGALVGPIVIPEQYQIGEFYNFRHPTLRPGFMPRQGGIITDAATQYPEIWAYLQTADGQLLCKTEAQWQAMTHAIWHTNADGTTVGWNGIGGAPFFVQDLNAGTLRLPDTRGMYGEDAGFDSLDVGGVHGDAVRNFAQMDTGGVAINGGMSLPVYNRVMVTGPFFSTGYWRASSMSGTGDTAYATGFDPSRIIPVAAKNQPRAFGVLPCVYLGRPAS